MKIHRLLAILAALTLLAVACGNGEHAGVEATDRDDGEVEATDGDDGEVETTDEDDGEVEATDEDNGLQGLIQLTAGECSDAGVTSGTYFRMVQPDGTVEEGPYVENGDSPCGDITFTPLAPGTDGGLTLGEHQPSPEPAFDDAGNGTASRIVEPAPFFAVQFAVSSNPTDPQTGDEAVTPTLSADADGNLSGNLAAVAAAWNGQHFNQGAPKPDGSRPGKTTGPTGTYDEATGAIVVEWTSQIVGGPFDNFTGLWHLEGTLSTG